jgi:hypothetical protein
VTVSRVLALGMLISTIPGAAALADPIGQTSAVDAYLDLGSGPYTGAGFIASGNPQAWYDSPQVAQLFGGVPTGQQQQSFDQAVLQRVQQTFQLSGISVTLTENAAVPALHTLSLVSNSSSSAFPGAIGTTDLGASGFSFIDPQAQVAQSVDQLEWIVAHNISHELMLAFGVGENYDTTGNYIDARNANLSMLLNPNATFSAGAAAAIKAQLPSSTFEQVFQPGAQGIAPVAAPMASTAQGIAPVPAPEPSTVAVWGILAAGAVVASRRRRTAR